MAKLVVGVNDLATMRPDLAAEWSDANEKSPSHYTCGSGKKVWWTCPDYGHEYDMDIVHRATRGQGCPYCSGRRTLPGFNDICTTNPELVPEWSDTNDKKPSQVSRGSHYDAEWICPDCGNTYIMDVKRRALLGIGCPYCNRTVIMPGVNDLTTTHPELSLEWSDKNQDSPADYFYGSQHKAWWKCPTCNHEWEAVIASRAQGHGCPECAKLIISKARTTPNEGESLAEKRPELLKEWDYEKNTLDPNLVKYRSNKYASWICSACGNTWEAVIASRSVGHGCPKCAAIENGLAKSKPQEGSSLLDMYPTIAKEFDIEKNGIGPDEITYGSNRKVWWRCTQCGHSWKASVHHRINGSLCPVCFRRSHSSFPEKAVFYYVSQVFPDAMENATPPIDGIGRMEFDIWIPSIRTAIEYDGEHWHNKKNSQSREISKDIIAYYNDIHMIHIREPNCPINVMIARTNTVYRESATGHESLDKAIIETIALLNKKCNISVDSARDYDEIYRTLLRQQTGTSLAEKYPDVAAMWHPTKNGGLTPSDINASYKTPVWWKCNKGHEYERKVANQCKSNSCLICTESERAWNIIRPVKGKSLGDLYPLIASEWMSPVDEKYKKLTPYDVKPSSNIRVTWQCKTCGRTWDTNINSRTSSHNDAIGCRSCRAKASMRKYYNGLKSATTSLLQTPEVPILLQTDSRP